MALEAHGSPAPAYPEPAPLGEMISDTGELTGACRQATRTCHSGYAPRSSTDRFRPQRPSALDEPAGRGPERVFAILCTSLDDLPIAESSRLLLVATAKVEYSGMAWQADGTTIADWGAPPHDDRTRHWHDYPHGAQFRSAGRGAFAVCCRRPQSLTRLPHQRHPVGPFR